MASNWMEKAAQREGKGNKAKTKAAYYKLQRQTAEEGGDQATTDKIYKKLGKKSHNVDSSRGDKAILAAAPFAPEAAGSMAEMTAARAASKLAPKAFTGFKRLASGVEKGAANLVKRGEGAIEGAVQHLGRARPVAKALIKGGAQGAAKGQARKIEGSAIRALENKGTKRLDNIGKPKHISGSKSNQKALPSKGHSEFDSELSKMMKKGKSMPKNPKTFNRSGSLRAEGRQKSTRNPTSTRKKKSA